MIPLIKSVKAANVRKRTKQVKGRGITAVVSKEMKLIALEACPQVSKY